MKKINEAERLEQMTQYERPFWERGIAVAGMDEVGRGPLAGPVVAAKTANLILGDVFGQPAYVCDTHCIRITGRLGITDGSKDPLQVERQLRERIPPKESNNFCHRMVLFGRDTCTARSPKCEGCPLAKDCDTAKAARRG